MKISYNWLREYIDFDETPDQIGEILTQTGLEVEDIVIKEDIVGGLKGLIVGEVISCVQHPNADRLKLTEVDMGEADYLPIVCGASNVAQGQKVVVAPINTMLHPMEGSAFKIKKCKIRGELSEGMICTEDEIGIGNSHDGIIILDDDAQKGSSVADLYQDRIQKDFILEIGLTPNRGDATSHWGVARDLKAYFNRELKNMAVQDLETTEEATLKVTIKNKERCPRFASIKIDGIEVKDAPQWLKKKLTSIGIDSINNVVDITNFVLHAIGQPMHVYDAHKLVSDELVIQTLPENTPFETLDGKERKLSCEDLIVCDSSGNGLCIAGVFGGKESGVSKNTTSVILESAYFSPASIRATAQKHALQTDASFRYERGTDPDGVIRGLKQATSLILSLAGGKIVSKVVDEYPLKINPRKISFALSDFERLIGTTIPEKDIMRILKNLDISVEHKGEELQAVVPPYRSDVIEKTDLAEEVLRIYGVNNIDFGTKIGSNYLAPFKSNEPYKIQGTVSAYLSGMGFLEILTNSLTNPMYHRNLSLGGSPVSILNSSSVELSEMKNHPVYTMLEVVNYNINRRNTNLKFFEWSKIYFKKGKEYCEKQFLTFLITGNHSEDNWINEPRKVTLFDLNTYLNSLFQMIGIKGLENKPYRDEGSNLLEYGVEMKLNNDTLASSGLLSGKVLDLFDIFREVFYAQVDLNLFFRNFKNEISYQPLPKFPEVKRDLSLVIDERISYAEVQKLAYKSRKNILKRINLFSVYKGEKIEKGKKSYALSFFLQDEYHTLTDRKIDSFMNSLMEVYEEELGATIRT